MKIRLSFNTIRWALLFAVVTTPLIWFNAFPIKKPFDGGDVLFESIYLACTLVSFFLIRKLSIQTLELGWMIFVYGLLIDLLDEFTREPDLVNTYIEGMLTSLGLVLVGVGFNRSYLKLREALAEVKTLSGLLPICASCKKIRNDKGYWEQIEVFIHKHSNADFSHGICPECAKKLYPDYDPYA